MKIIGHRGAAGLAPENTLAAIRAGVKAGADFIEFDVRQTRDGQLVLCHDPGLSRTFNIDKKVADLTLKQIRQSCPELPTLSEALTASQCQGVIVELKEVVDAAQLVKVFQRFPKLDIRVASFEVAALKAVQKQSPGQFCYFLQHRHWRRTLKTVQTVKADGLGLHYAAINPFLYYIAKRRGLQIYIYTLNWPWLAKIYQRIYPQIFICTDKPRLI